MNDAETFPIDVEEMRAWMNARKRGLGCSWTALAELSGIKYGTLTTFCGGTYQGVQENVAREIFKYKQMVDSQAERAFGVQTEPGFFETKTSRRINALLLIAQRGRITVCATGPGTGKTITMRKYQSNVSNVWVATMKPTSKTLAAMITEVLRAIGVPSKTGWTRQLSNLVQDALGGKQGLLVIDEANHLELDSIEELRAWHDATGVGICLMGNEELMQRIRSGPQRDQFARLNSRIAQSHVQNLPDEEDVVAFCDAWGLPDQQMRDLLTRIALTPGAGGLRECRQIVESASMLAVDDGRPLSFADLRDAQASRATRSIRS